jgi:GMP synthase (glutamine-hydrolysing)
MADFPILGICVGCQFMAIHFGGEAGPADIPEFGSVDVVIDKPGELLAGIRSPFKAWESHNDEVVRMPSGFKVLAHSDSCAVEAIRMLDRPIFGLQFHPEVENTEHGYDIFKNFLKVVEDWKR